MHRVLAGMERVYLQQEQIRRALMCSTVRLGEDARGGCSRS
jgi:hypothetical protein